MLVKAFPDSLEGQNFEKVKTLIMYAMYMLQDHPTTLLLLQMIPWHLIRVPLHHLIMMAEETCPD